jgi:hypothetical protein
MAVASIDIDPVLLEDAKRVTGQSTTQGVVTAALQAVIRGAEQLNSLAEQHAAINAYLVELRELLNS